MYGISADKPKSQANWRKKEGLTYNLLCDPSKKVRQQAGGMLHDAARQLQWKPAAEAGAAQPTGF